MLSVKCSKVVSIRSFKANVGILTLVFVQVFKYITVCLTSKGYVRMRESKLLSMFKIFDITMPGRSMEFWIILLTVFRRNYI